MLNRTIIDILRKGNQELFHSSMMAWLLDPGGAEHGWGSAFLVAFAEAVERKGHPRMLAALRETASPQVRTEVTDRKSRYDIVLRIGTTTVVIENKTKSLGDEPQFKKYEGNDFVLVALGYCDISFSAGVRCKYPVLTYGEVLSILDGLPEQPPSDFRVLLEHYRRYLRRELTLLSEIDAWCGTGDPVHADRVLTTVRAGAYTENDRRFLNLYLLERLRDALLQSPRWRACTPRTDKNMQSGVWLALFGIEGEPGCFAYEEPLAAVCQQNGVKFWFHVELSAGVLAAADDAQAGVVQLRCNASGNAAKVAAEFRQGRPLRDGERYPSTVKRTADSVFLVLRPLLRKQLPCAQFVRHMDSFAESFGRFGS